MYLDKCYNMLNKGGGAYPFQPKSKDFTVGQAVKAKQILVISKEYSSLL